MYKPSAKTAKIAVVALAIPLLGGFATYAAAQVSTKPAPQVVIPGGPGRDDKVTTSTVRDDKGHHPGTPRTTPTSVDDHGRNGGDSPTAVSDDPGGHDANDDQGHDGSTPSTGATPTSVDDHGGDRGQTPATVSDDPAGHDANDDHGDDAITPGSSTPTTATTPTSVNDRSGQSGGSGHHGGDG